MRWEATMTLLKKILLLILIGLLFWSCDPISDTPEIPAIDNGPEIEGSWPKWGSYESAGWSRERIDTAKTYFNSLRSASVMVIYQGRVLICWGSYQSNYYTHSVRKSFMSAVYGIYVDRGIIDLSKTMSQLGIDDEPPLTEDEKRATILHLLQARSGVFHTAAAETEGMHAYKPERGTYGPGEFWCYNNWDFNALATIFDQESGSDFFTALQRDLNSRLGMEDYIPAENQYSYQLDRSIHPAYGFRISTRDAARFGQLFLQLGIWNGERILSADWIERSTKALSDSSAYIPGTHYGYMWWCFPAGYGSDSGLSDLSRYRSYAALGAYGQVIQVIPELDLVYVHRVNSFRGDNVSLGDVHILLDRILAAKN